jgi:GNAT superfamily N-acetyltransferase
VTHLEKLRIRIADHSETGHILGAYERWGYGAGINPDDVVWVAEVGTELVGVVRIATENAVLVLRGMRVADRFRGRGIGSQMLNVAIAWLGKRECFCLPYIHLTGFYARAGFIEIEPASAPPFLMKRIARYNDRALNVTIMRRHIL